MIQTICDLCRGVEDAPVHLRITEFGAFTRSFDLCQQCWAEVLTKMNEMTKTQKAQKNP